MPIRVKDPQDDFLKEATKLFAKLPPPKNKPLEIPKKQQCVCGKMVDYSVLEQLNTGVFVTLSDVCKGCKEGHDVDKRSARFVCAKCKRVLMRVRPGTDKTGFRLEAGKTYHLAKCPGCASALDKTDKGFPLIEKVVWNRSHNINTGENSNTKLD